MTHTSTHTYTLLTVSSSTFQEIKKLLEEAGYGDQISLDMDADNYGQRIDMHGLALVEHPGKCTYKTLKSSEEEGRYSPCNATLVRCRCGAKWCLDHQANPLVCPQCGRRG